jgi:antitoxin HicB
MRLAQRERFKYRILVRYSEEDQGYIAEVPELKGCSAWGESEVEAFESVTKAASAWIESAHANGIEIPTPIDERKVSGKFPLRLPPELYRELAFEAAMQGSSLNQFLVYKLSRLVGGVAANEYHSSTSTTAKASRKNT